MQKVRRFGVPYMGSKNKIATWVVDRLPPAEHFYDLFCGGCAVTHAAMLSGGKWRKFHINDIVEDVAHLFVDACNGKYRDETRWISREDFSALKDSEAYVRLVWSFGNNGQTYMYSREIERWKKALHYARVFGDTSLLREFGIESDGSRQDIVQHHAEYKEKYIKWYIENVWHKADEYDDIVGIYELQKAVESLEKLQRLQSLESLQSLQRLESLQRRQSLQRLQLTTGDYTDVEILPNSTIYCDIPYKGTAEYCGNDGKAASFDHDRFYEWALSRDFPVFVSSYDMPEDFALIAEKGKRALFSGQGNSDVMREGIYVQKKFANKFKMTLF